MKRLPLVTVLALLAVTVAISVGLAAGSPGASPSPSSGRVAQQPTLSPAASPKTSAPPSSGPPTVPPTATPPQLAAVPIVPVTQFRATAERTTSKEVAAVLAGTSKTYDALELVDADADAILAALSAERPAAGDPHLILAGDAQTLVTDLAKNRKHLAFLRAGQVAPGVRALGWGDALLFGEGHVKQTADWPLTAQLPADAGSAATQPFDVSKLWISSPAATSSSTAASPRP